MHPFLTSSVGDYLEGFSSGFNGLCEIWSEALNQQTGVTIYYKTNGIV